MSRLPLISIIVPVYNVSAYLDRTLQSIVNQSYKELEIILVNDGSTDNSGQLCDRWAEKDARIRVVHQENGGPSRARNAALDIAQGEFILLCDSDDLVSPEMCRTLYEALGEGGDIAVCDYVHIFPDTDYRFTVSDQREVMDPETVIRKMWYQTGFMPSACAKLYRKKIFRELRFTPGLIFEDIDLLHEIFHAADAIVYTPSALYGYVHRENSITTTPFSKRDLDIFRVTERILTFAQAHPSLRPAAEAYAATAALRIYLNAPSDPVYTEGVAQAKKLLSAYGKTVMKDPQVRRKNKVALRLYFLCKPLLRFAYKHINRWK